MQHDTLRPLRCRSGWPDPAREGVVQQIDRASPRFYLRINRTDAKGREVAADLPTFVDTLSAQIHALSSAHLLIGRQLTRAGLAIVVEFDAVTRACPL